MTLLVEAGPVLGLDCSAERCSVALVRSGRCEIEVERTCPGEQLRLLLPMVKEMLGEAGLTPFEVKRIAVTVGPGSFTGLRLGISLARTFAQLTGSAAVPVGTLLACAWGMEHWWAQGERAGEAALVCPVLDARKGQVFAAAWRTVPQGEGGWALQECEEPRALDPAAATGWLAELGQRGGGMPMLVGGTGLRAFPRLLEGVDGAVVVPADEARVHARDVALVGAGTRGEVPLLTYADLAPVYLRAPDVQVPKRARGL